MPSCTDFGVIDQYLILKDQIDSEDDSSYSITTEKKPQLPATFLGPVDQDLTTASLAFSAMEATAEAWWPSNFLLSGPDPHHPHPARTTPTPFPASGHASSFVGGFLDTGCTVIEASSPADGAPFPDEAVSDSSDLYDLDCGDKHAASLYGDYPPACKREPGVGEDQHGQDVKPPVTGVPERPGIPMEDSLMFREDRDDITSFMIQSLRDDIMRDCKELRISADPEQWSSEETGKWISSVMRSGNPPAVYCKDPHVLRVFHMPGEVLCRMSLPDFQRCSPFGEFLYQQLEIWKMAREIISDSDTPHRYPPQHPHHPSPHPHHHPYNHHHYHPTTTTTPIPGHRRMADPPMPPCLSPAPSSDSLSSSSSSSSSSLSSIGGRGAVAPHCGSANSLGFAHDHYDDVFRAAPTAAAATARRKAPQLAAPHPTPAHLPTPTRGPRTGKQTIHLWQFLRELLDNADSYHDCIKWTDRARGIFKIEDSSKVARLWGRRKNRPAMNYDKLSRSVRQYYKKGIIRKTEHSKRLVYQFCQPYL